MVSRCSIAASGMIPSTTARPRSAAIRIGRRRKRSSGEEANYKYRRRARSGKESHLKGRRFQDEDGSEGQTDASDVGSDLRDPLTDPQLAEIGIEPTPVPRPFWSVTQVYRPFVSAHPGVTGRCRTFSAVSVAGPKRLPILGSGNAVWAAIFRYHPSMAGVDPFRPRREIITQDGSILS